jgi:hypothetical protein
MQASWSHLTHYMVPANNCARSWTEVGAAVDQNPIILLTQSTGNSTHIPQVRPGSNEAGAIFASGMNNVFLGSLTQPEMFHALSLVLSLATSTSMQDLDALQHRGNMLKDVRRRMTDAKLVPSISTLTAMLLLIGSEVRMRPCTVQKTAEE